VNGPRSSNRRILLRLSTAAFFCSIARLTIAAASFRLSGVHPPAVPPSAPLLPEGDAQRCRAKFQFWNDLMFLRNRYSRFIAMAQHDHPESSSKASRKNLLTLRNDRIDRKSRHRSRNSSEELPGRHSWQCCCWNAVTGGGVESAAIVPVSSNPVSSKSRKNPHMYFATSPSIDSIVKKNISVVFLRSDHF